MPRTTPDCLSLLVTEREEVDGPVMEKVSKSNRIYHMKKALRVQREKIYGCIADSFSSLIDQCQLF